MNELIKIQTKGDQQLVSARDLYKGLEIKKRFSAWWEQNSKEFEESVDFQPVLISTPRENRGTIQLQDYALTIDMAKQLCLLSRTEKGKQYRQYLIQVEKKWNSPQEIIRRAHELLENENLQLRIENKKLLETSTQQKAEIEKLAEVNTQQEQKIEKDADDVLFSHAIRTANRSIPVRELSVLLTQNGFVIGEKQLFAMLRKTKYLSAQKSTWNLPNITKVKSGYFKVVHKVSFSGVPYRQTLVTVKGQKHLINKALRGKFDDIYNQIVEVRS